MRVEVQSGRRPFLDYGQFYDAITRGDIDKVKAMLDAGANIERERDDGGTPLLIAIYRHHVDIVKLLLKRGADVNRPVIDSPPIFHAATRSEHAPELIQVLLDHGADLEATASDTHLSVLHWAVGNNTLHATDFLISKGADINRTCKTGKTPLLFAAEKGHTEMVKLLHAKGSDIHVHSRNGGTPLMWASSCGRVETVRFLLEKGARVDDYDDEGMTALSVASRAGFLEIVEMLLEKGANVNALSKKPSKCTPAAWAAISGHGQVLQALIRHGADLSITMDDKITILEAAMKRGRLNTTQILLEAIGGPDYPKDSVAVQIALTRCLADSRPLVNCISIMFPHINTTRSPVGKLDWIEWVLEQGGDLVRPRAMRNLMHFALETEQTDMVTELLRLGVDPNMTIFDGETPLHAAVSYRNKDLIRVLVDAGADPARVSTSSDTPMITPLHQAIIQLDDDAEKDTSIVDILLATGRCKLMVGDDAKSTAFAYILRRFSRWKDGATKALALRMLESVSDVNDDCSADGSTLMHTAVWHGKTKLIDALRDKGADMNPKDKWGDTPFLTACGGDAEILDFLIARGAHVHAVDAGGYSALHLAAAHGQVEVLRVLLDLTGDHALEIDTTDKLGHTALMTAMAADYEDAALYLLSRGASPRHRMHKGRTVLQYAATTSMQRVADKLLAGPDASDLVNAQDNEGWTPLAAACTAPSPTIVATLLAHGANTNTINPFTGNAPLHLALKRPMHMARRDSKHEDPALILLRAPDTDTTARDTRLRTPLHLASAFHNVPAAKMLLDQPNVAVNAVDDKGRTPLSLCANPDIATALVQHGADVNHAEPNGWTPLHHAVDRCWVKTYEVLLDSGADVDARTSDDGLTVTERMERMGGWDKWVRSEYEFIVEDVERERRREERSRGRF